MIVRTAIVLVLLSVGAIGAGAADVWIHVKGDCGIQEQLLHEMEAKLQSYVESNANRQGRTLRTWSEYTFQYQERQEAGRKYVFVNALCQRDPNWNLEKETIVVHDGGSCFFRLKYDPNRREFYDLAINGEA